MITQTLILAAGSGTRLDRPGRPKALVEVGGRPLVFHLVEQLARVGIERILVVTGFEDAQLKKEITTHFVPELDVSFVDNPEWEKGIATSVLAARPFLTEPFLLAMGDHVFDGELVEQMARIDVSDGRVTLLVDRRDPESFPDSAVRVLCEGGLVRETGVSIPKWNGIDTGLFAASPAALFGALEETYLRRGQDSLWSATNHLARQGRLDAADVARGTWNDIDTPVDLVRAEIRLRHERRVGAVVAPRIEATRAADDAYDFVAGKIETTKMVLMRGYFRNPGAFELIPRESASSPVFLFTDETVDGLYASGLAKALKAMGYHIHRIVMPDGEGSKSLSRYQQLTEQVLSLGVDEQSVFVSVGGGVVCNVCGFIASTIYRGLNLIHLPTSLMAQCDAAISHKQAINGRSGKNMVGSYYNPRMVVVDVETLETLDPRLIHDGLAEVIKHALCQDRSYVDYLAGYGGDCVSDLDFLEQVIRRNIGLKCALSIDDPKELAEGMVLQYGHTLGHPVEHLSGYTLYHGESVAIGMVIAARVARILRACSGDLVDLHEEIISRYRLPTRIPRGIAARDVLDACKYNKRYLTEGTRMALLEGVGRPWVVSGQYVVPVANEVLLEAIGLTMEV